MKAVNTEKGMTTRTLVPFLAIAFGLAWGLMGLYFAFPEQLESIFGPVGYANPLFVISVYAPAIAGLALTLRHYGIRGLGSFLRRLTFWRMPLVGWAFLVLGIPAVFYAGAAINGTLTGPEALATLLPSLALMLVLGPMEEFGWRGVALPLLQRKYTPFVASLVLGVIWAVWHLPAFFLGGTPQSGWSFGSFFLGVMAITMILTAMFNASAGSLLIAALYHFQMNNPAWPDAQPWDSVLFAVIAIVLVIVHRKKMFSREASVTDVIASPAAEKTEAVPAPLVDAVTPAAMNR